MQTVQTQAELKHLFEIRLEYKQEKPPVSEAGKVGEYIGSGEGTVDGAEISGSVHWTLFETQSETICESNLFGIIETEDGAEIKFDTMGFFMRPDKTKPHQWTTSAAVTFVTEDERYTWLNSVLGVWSGEFNMKTYKHHYQVYVNQT